MAIEFDPVRLAFCLFDGEADLLEENLVELISGQAWKTYIFREHETGKYWRYTALETEEDVPFDIGGTECEEVRPVQKTVTVFEPHVTAAA